MAAGFVDIDHLMVSVADSQRAGEVFERLGFTATPHSVLPGLSNRLICFPGRQAGACNYIELMSLDDASAAPPPMPELLSPSARPVSMVLGTADIDACFADLQAKSVETPPPLHLQRDWLLPSGETITPAFAVLIPRPGQSPCYWNVCQHKTPQHYVRPEFVTHANGASAMTAVIAVAADPAAAGRHYRAMWDARLETGDPVSVRLGAVELRIYALATLAAAYPGLAIADGPDRLLGFAVAVPDAGSVAERLARGGVAMQGNAGNSCYLLPNATGGALVVFENDAA